jgi:hypothetical protein
MKPGEPGISAQKRGELQMNDLWAIPTQDSAHTPDWLPAEQRGVRQHFQGTTGHFQVLSHLFAGWAGKAEHALPTALSELTGQFASKHFNATDSKWLDVEEREHCLIQQNLPCQVPSVWAVCPHLSYPLADPIS